MDENFISKCSFCGRCNLYNFDDIISLTHQENVTGFVTCKECEKRVPVELTRCEKCGLGWKNRNDVPTAVELNDVRQPIVLKMEMPCLTCEPSVEEHHVRFGHPFIEPP